MKKIIVSILVIGLLLSSASLTAGEKETPMAPFDGNTLYVGGNGSGNYSSIQEGVNNASEGDTVFVYDESSPYYENIDIGKSINLIGENRNTTIIDGNENGHVVHISVEEVTVSGFTIQNASGGYPDNYAGIYLCSDYNIISSNIIADNYRGITFSQSSYNNISNNIIISNNDSGLNLYFSNNNNFMGNTITNNFIGLCQWSSNNTISGNTISSNYFGISIDGGDDNIISENIINLNCWGIATSSSNNVIDNNTISNNEEYGINLQQGPNSNSIENNNISNSDMGIALYLHSWNNTISGNKVTNNRMGIYISGSDSYDNIICENSLRKNKNSIFLNQCNNNHIYHNNIINNTYKVFDTGANNWDNGYPSGGNFFSEYSGNDSFHGPNQDIPGSDGIGDTSHSIYGSSNKDKYPLMNISGWINYPPNAPNITGEVNGETGEEYIYMFVTSDAEGHPVYYWIDWGDGTNTSWIGSFASGEVITVSHTWSEQGTYTISAKAKDTRDAESDWATLPVTMPLNQISTKSVAVMKSIQTMFSSTTNGMSLLLR